MTSEPSTAATRLCAACGMCCDGVLFHSVVLQTGDSARALTALGLRVKRKKGQDFFHQPCPAHGNGRCSIYESRPTRCRLFNCQQVLRVSAGEASEAAALEKIREARRRVGQVDQLIHRLAETNPHRALAQRCANALTIPNPTPLHNELSSAMQELEALLERDFRVN